MFEAAKRTESPQADEIGEFTRMFQAQQSSCNPNAIARAASSVLFSCAAQSRTRRIYTDVPNARGVPPIWCWIVAIAAASGTEAAGTG